VDNKINKLALDRLFSGSAASGHISARKRVVPVPEEAAYFRHALVGDSGRSGRQREFASHSRGT
jgi:hypothetical protein